MKRYVLILFFSIGFVSLVAQRNNQSSYYHDIQGNLQYEVKNGYKAAFKTDIFEDKIFTDNRGNEIKYTKKFLSRMPDYDDSMELSLFQMLVSDNKRRKNYKETYSVDIMGTLEYEVKNGIKASLKTDIFGSKIYTDNRGNQIEYSKEFLQKIPGYSSRMDELLFHSLVVDNRDNKNYKEKYSVDIFGTVEYSNNKGWKVTIERDIFNDIRYRDNWGVSASIRKNIFGDMEYSDNSGKRATVKKDIFGDYEYSDNQGNRISARKDIFGDLSISDNKGNKTEIKTDIFGDLNMSDNKGNRSNLRRDIFGYLEYTNNKGGRATLRKDIFDKWTYTDNKKNKVEFDKDTWSKMMQEHGDDQKIMLGLVYKYLEK